jgi:signal peptide peptidase SppA
VTLAETLLLKQPWLITPEAHAALVAVGHAFFESPGKLTPPAKSGLLSVENGVGVVNLTGPLIRKPDFTASVLFGATDTDEAIAAVREAGQRPDVEAVFLDIDSPGGTVSGTPELANAVTDVCAQKYTYAFTAGQMCSAAYWVGSQCDAVYATPSARVGSIGVLLPVMDSSEAMQRQGLKVEVFAAGKFKSTGMPGVPLTDEQRAWLQADVEEIATEFRSAVLARGRKVTPDVMEGQTFSARKAAYHSLISGVVSSRADAIAKLRSRHVAG